MIKKTSPQCYRIGKRRVYFIFYSETGRLVRKKLDDANPGSFRCIEPKVDKLGGCYVSDVWGLDDNNVFYQNIKLESADPMSFEVLNNGFSKDNKSVFYKAKQIPEADTVTFRVRKSGFACDCNTAYRKYMPINGIEFPDTFMPVDEFFVKDSANIYRLHGLRAIKTDADIQTFQIIKLPPDFGYYSYRMYKDKSNAYFIETDKTYAEKKLTETKLSGYTIENIDSDSFEVLPTKYYTKDKNSVYFRNEKLHEVYVETFRVLKPFYSTDGINVYYKNILIKDAEPLSFKPIEISYQNVSWAAKDSKSFFHQDRQIQYIDSEMLKI